MNMKIFEKQRNSWQFCEAKKAIIEELTNHGYFEYEIITKVENDFPYGITPNQPRYELDARL